MSQSCQVYLKSLFRNYILSHGTTQMENSLFSCLCLQCQTCQGMHIIAINQKHLCLSSLLVHNHTWEVVLLIFSHNLLLLCACHTWLYICDPGSVQEWDGSWWWKDTLHGFCRWERNSEINQLLRDCTYIISVKWTIEGRTTIHAKTVETLEQSEHYSYHPPPFQCWKNVYKSIGTTLHCTETTLSRG